MAAARRDNSGTNTPRSLSVSFQAGVKGAIYAAELEEPRLRNIESVAIFAHETVMSQISAELSNLSLRELTPRGSNS